MRKRERINISEAIAIKISDIEGYKDFERRYMRKVIEKKRIMKLNNEEFDRLYKGYQRMNKVIREYCEEKGWQWGI